MAKNHVWRIKKENFRQLMHGDKTIEVRVGYPGIAKVRTGDTISFENYGSNFFLVTEVLRCPSFEALLSFVNSYEIIPGKTWLEVSDILKDIYPPEKERLGVYGFRLKNISNGQIKHASELIKSSDSHRELADFVSQSFMITEWISRDYPQHTEHFYCKYVPGIFLVNER